MVKFFDARGSMFPCILACLFGIVLPAITLLVEATTAMCAEAFFDPIPTVFHVALVALVPLANFMTALWLRKGASGTSRHLRLAVWVNGAALAVTTFYSVIFIPMLPIACIGIIAWGLGFLPLSPFLALPSTWHFRRRLKAVADHRSIPLPHALKSFILVASLMLVIEMPAALTHLGTQMAVAETPALRQAGISFLRQVGSPSVLFELAHGRSAPHLNLPGLVVTVLGRHLRWDDGRKLYFRVYGHTFSDAPASHRQRRWSWRTVRHMRSRRRGTADGVYWDGQQGSSLVGPRLAGLSLRSSRLDGSLDPVGAVGYLEWTMEFRNTLKMQREARTLIALPPKAVVSRVTLWVNGEEREAAFAGKGKVREAYEKIVRRRRDPLLVTEKRKDRVLAQCFPVPPEGTMKVRIGMTTPMPLPTRDRATLSLPTLSERNFSIAPDLTHLVWLESKSPLDSSANKLHVEERPGGSFSLMGHLNDNELNEVGVTVHALRDPAITTVWCRDERPSPELAQTTRTEATDLVVSQTFCDLQHEERPHELIVVLDGSRALKNHGAALKVALASLPRDIPTTILRAGETVTELSRPLTTVRFEGGCDNAPALVEAIKRLNGRHRGAILWIHGAQPYLFSPQYTVSNALIETKAQRSLPIFHLSVSGGENVIVDELQRIRGFQEIPRHGDIAENLLALFKRWDGTKPLLEGQRRLVSLDYLRALDETQAHPLETSSHLVRLWARDEVERLAKSENDKERARATAIAAHYQLVTSVSGAVVLESEEQYKEAGLEPVKKSSVPTVPEPEEWALLLVTFFILAHSYRRKQYGTATKRMQCCAV